MKKFATNLATSKISFPQTGNKPLITDKTLALSEELHSAVSDLMNATNAEADADANGNLNSNSLSFDTLRAMVFSFPFLFFFCVR